jgi:hypothetical protein
MQGVVTTKPRIEEAGGGEQSACLKNGEHRVEGRGV